MIGAILLAGLAAGAPPPPGALAWVGFPFRPPQERTAAPGAEVSFAAAGSDVDELAVFLEARGDGLRWQLLGSRREARGTIVGEPGRTAIALFRLTSGRGYLFDGPFVWPTESARRTIGTRAFRTVGGKAPAAEAGTAIHVLPADGALCEMQAFGVWHCAGVPADEPELVVGALPGGRAFWAEVPPGTVRAAESRAADWCALVRLEGPPDGADRPPPTVSMQRPGPAQGALLNADAAFEHRVVAPSLVWLAGDGPPAGRIATFARGILRGRVELPQILANPALPEPVPVALRPPAAARGTITDADGRPVASAMALLLETAPPPPGEKPSTRVAADGATDRLGRYEFGNLAPAAYRLRVCDGTLGCAEREIDLDAAANDLVLEPRVSFAGRAVSRGGVPEAGAWIRISPALSTYERSADRLRLLPLVARADGEGRFRIAAPGTGRFLIEARSDRGGVARRSVEATDFSPAVTQLGDLTLSVPGSFQAVVAGCMAGVLHLTGPVGGENVLPASLEFPLDAEGRGEVQLPEAGAWIAIADCGGVRRPIVPQLLDEVRELFGTVVRFELAREETK